MDSNKKWITEKAVSQMTGIKLSTLRAYRFKQIGIPYSKLGRLVRYSLQDVIAYMEAHRIVPAS